MLTADVVVVGAGLGGLAAAAALAKSGKRVCVLERHAVPGGYAHEFRRGRYRFEVSLHALDGASPGGTCYEALRELGVLDRVRFHRLDPIYVLRLPDRTISAHADPFRYEAELAQHFPGELIGIRALLDEMHTVYREVRRARTDAQLGARSSLSDWVQRYPYLKRAMTESWDAFMSRHTANAQLKAVLSTLWGFFGLPPSQLSAISFVVPWVSYHQTGAFYPEGGSFAMTRALEGVIREHGGELLYRQTVNRIVRQGRKVVGVTTEQGLEVRADAVVSNANIPDTFTHLMDPDELPRLYARRAKTKPPSISTVTLYLGLDPSFHGADRLPHELWVSEDYDIEAQYVAVRKGDWQAVPFSVTRYNQHDPGCAPPGGTVLALLTLAPWDYADVWGTHGHLTDYQENPRYQQVKQQVTDVLLNRLEALLPGVRSAIRYQETGTPLTNQRYTGNYQGAVYGFEQSVEGMVSDRFRMQTPIHGLFLAGAWATCGGQSAALVSGFDAADLVLRYMSGQGA